MFFFLLFFFGFFFVCDTCIVTYVGNGMAIIIENTISGDRVRENDAYLRL